MADDRQELAEAARTVVEGASDAASDLAAAEALVEAAEERAEAAEEAAELLTEAALRSELGRQLSDMQSEFATWRASTESRLENLAMENRSMAERLESLSTALEAQKASQTPSPAAPLQEIPLSSIPQELAEEAAQVIDPATAESAPVAAPVVLVAAPARRGRWT